MNFVRGKQLALIMAGVGVLLSCSPENPKAYHPAVRERARQSTMTVDPRLDVLFVVDNSGSMYTHQANLAANVAKFTAEFNKSSFLDFHIGVITTDDSGGYYGSGECCGRLLGNPRFVTNTTPDLNNILAKRIMVGTSGSGTEAVFDPIQKALSDPNLTGWNAGFYRPGATLAMVFITDAEDQSTKYDESSFYNFILQLKGGNASKALGFGVIVPSTDNGMCDRDEAYSPPEKIERFLAKLPNAKDNVMSLCSPDYGNRLGFMARNIVDIMTTIHLERVPYVPSIKVRWGDRELSSDARKGWAYDAKKNAIVLGAEIDWKNQPLGTPISIEFEVAQFE